MKGLAVRTIADLERDGLALFLGYRAALEEHQADEVVVATDARSAAQVLADLSKTIDSAEVRL